MEEVAQELAVFSVNPHLCPQLSSITMFPSSDCRSRITLAEIGTGLFSETSFSILQICRSVFALVPSRFLYIERCLTSSI